MVFQDVHENKFKRRCNMKPIFELPMLLNLNGNPFDGTLNEFFAGPSECSVGCAPGCAAGCEMGTGKGDPLAPID
jgi:hypothetical protein